MSIDKGKAPFTESMKGSDAVLPCVICAFTAGSKPDILRHMAGEHRLLIAEVDKIGSLQKYLAYWNGRLKGNQISDFASTFDTHKGVSSTENVIEKYYLLSDILGEDRKVRESLQPDLLKSVLSKEEEERASRKERPCLFCTDVFHGERSEVWSHMHDRHGLNIGHHDNLVNADALLDLLRSKLDSLICITCERTFKTKAVLKSHMKKKNHMKIPPGNKEYDQFYLVNYVEFKKDWHQIRKEEEETPTSDGEDEDGTASMTGDGTLGSVVGGDDEWDDWVEPQDPVQCLFCEQSHNPESVWLHMENTHAFNLEATSSEWGLTFYDKVKIVNYLRKRIREGACPVCAFFVSEGEEKASRLYEHMMNEGHCKVDREGEWTETQYLLPAVSEDPILTLLQDDDDEVTGGDDDVATASAQDLEAFRKKLAGKDLRKLSVDDVLDVIADAPPPQH